MIQLYWSRQYSCIGFSTAWVPTWARAAATGQEAAMATVTERRKVHFTSAGVSCAAWHYPGDNGGCVVMAPGLAVTKEPGTDPLAGEFQKAGYTVLAFDYRHLGESEGLPRQLVRFDHQLADWAAALDFAARLPEVDPNCIAAWGFSASGGHVFELAARRPDLAAAIAHAPLADGVASFPNALRHMTVSAFVRLVVRAGRDAVGGWLGRAPLTVALAGPRGAVATLTTPDSRNYARALNPGNRYPQWRQEVSARSALRIGFYRPGRRLPDARCPVLVLAYADDGVAPSAPTIRAAARSPPAEVVRLPGGHYNAFLDGHDEAVAAMVSFLDRHLLHRRMTHVGER
jgi:pimeloyl-ACP methyl ester carboxylesterase